MKFAYCPCCMYRTRIERGGNPEDYACPRHGLKLYDGNLMPEKIKELYGDVFACDFAGK